MMMKKRGSMVSKVMVLCALLGTLTVASLAGSASPAGAQGCLGYTPLAVSINPPSVQAGDAVTIEGFATGGETVTATLESTPSAVLGSAVAGFVGDFTIVGNIPGSVGAGTYSITMTSASCPRFEVSVVVTAPIAPLSVLGRSVSEEPTTTQAPATTAAPATTVAPTTTAAPTTTVAAPAPVTSSCAATQAGRTFIPGQQVSWVLSDATYDRTKDVRLRIRDAATGTTLYNAGAWPASNELAVRIPVNQAPGQYVMEQTGYLTSTGKASAKNCSVWVTAAPTNAAAGSSLPGAASELPWAVIAIGVLTAAGLFQLRRIRRAV